MARLMVDFDISPYDRPQRPLSIKSFTIRETDGKDEDAAAIVARARGGTATVMEELVKRAIMFVDGQPVNHTEGVPFEAWDGWNSATRSFVTNAFQSVNGFMKEDADFLTLGKVHVA
jgi:hypothetical protein